MKEILFIVSILLLTSNIYASPPTRVNSYTPNQTILSDDVTENEDAIFNYLQAGVNTYEDGSIVNADINAAANIQAEKINLTNVAQNILNTGTLANVGNVTITGTLTATDIQEGGANLVPQGIIVMWSGAIASIPTGWELCDGTCTITCPDLRDKFIMGAGSSYAVDATGGSATVTLTTNEMPAHTHTITMDDNSGSGDLHPLSSNGTTHSGTDNTGSSGNGAAFSVLNPYYALAFLIKN